MIHRRSWRRTVRGGVFRCLALAALLSATGCGDQSGNSAQPAPAATTSGGAKEPAAASSWAGASLRGSDAQSLRTYIQSGAAVGGLGPPCKRVTYAAVGHVGIETNIIPLPFGASESIENALSPKKEIFKLSQEITDPPIKMCQIG